jgi:hypothetical protein
MRLRFALLLFVFALPAFAQKTYSNVEQMSGWSGCSACAEGASTATFGMTRGMSSPSMDGKSAMFSIGGSKPWALALWHKFLGYDDAVKNATMDFYLYGKQNQNSNGMEFAMSQAVGGKWYKWSVQFSFNKNVISVWDSANHKWVSTGVKAIAPSNSTWHHYKFTFNITPDHKVGFLTFVVDGTTHYINKYFGPQSTSNHGISTHMQLNLGATAADYAIYVDKFNITVK